MVDTAENHPLLSDYLKRRDNNNNNNNAVLTDSTSQHSFMYWTHCDEMKRCSCAVLSFLLIASVVGAALVLFWFLWAWFVLYLDLPGIATPVVWLLGFVAPLCLIRIFSSLPRCARGCFADPLTPPDIATCKAGQLWSQRRSHVECISQAVPSIPLPIVEIISDYCFHSDLIATTHGNKLLGIFVDTAEIHTIAEFSKEITDLAVGNGNIHSVYTLVSRSSQKAVADCRSQLSCEGGDIESQNEPQNGLNNRNNDNNENTSVWSNLPKWLWDSTEHVDMIVCEYDISKGALKRCSDMFVFQQLSNSAMQQLKGNYYRPNYRMIMDEERGYLVVSRDGEYVVFDKALRTIQRRELIAQPENGDDRNQFDHLRQYRWNSSVIVPSKIVYNIMSVVDQVEQTNSTNLIDDNHVYVVIPFGEHALFVGNISTGWLRYLDFSRVNPIADSQIHYVSFSVCNQYIYLCLTQSLVVMSVVNFQHIVTVPFTNIDYTIPCGLIRTPPEELQIMKLLHEQKLKLNNHNSTNVGPSTNDVALKTNEESNGENENEVQKQLRFQSYVQEMSKKLESILVVFASTRIMLDPRVFLYRFPRNKCRVVSNIVGKKRKVYDGSYLLERSINDTNIEHSTSENASWQYISLKHRPWNQHTITARKLQSKRVNDDMTSKDSESDANKVVPILNRY